MPSERSVPLIERTEPNRRVVTIVSMMNAGCGTPGSSAGTGAAKKKTTVKKAKAATKKSTAAKSATKKSTAKKSAAKKSTAKKSTAAKKKSTAAKKPKKEKSPPPPVREWWKEEPLPEGKKWRTLRHNGVAFTPDYVPHGRPILYDGEEIVLPPMAELYANHFAHVAENPLYGGDPVFANNFFTEWRKKHLVPAGLGRIKKLNKVGWGPILTHLEQEKEAKKSRSKAVRDAEKAAKEEIKQHLGFADIDGFREPLGNFTIEPPGLFRGRGAHPKRGCLKPITWPEDITLNLSADAPIPECPIPGHKWGAIVHNDEAMWIAYWKEKVCGQSKYVWPAAGAANKQRSDMAKFQKARELQYHVDDLRTDYARKFRSSNATDRQLGLAAWIIDVLALRVGMEKNAEEEAETFGCCSLLVEHTELLTDGDTPRLRLSFLGKDSMPYDNTTDIPADFATAFAKTIKGKAPSDSVFDAITPSRLNEYFKEFMHGLSAKVFRTYNASVTLERELAKAPANMTPDEARVFYNAANFEVAVLCNHQKTVDSDKLDAQLDKMKERLAAAKAKLKERKDTLKELKAASPKDPKKIKRAKELHDKQKARVSKINADLSVKRDTASVALGTSKINYMDPRVTVAFCKRVGLAVEMVFNPALMQKFPWAMDVDEDFRFVCSRAESGIPVKPKPVKRSSSKSASKKSAAKRKRSTSTKSSRAKKTSTAAMRKKTSAAAKKKASAAAKKKKAAARRKKKKADDDFDSADDGADSEGIDPDTDDGDDDYVP